MTADEFAELNTPQKRNNKIGPFRDEVLKLRRMQFSVNQILQFLQINGVTVTYAALAEYLRRNLMTEDGEIPPQARRGRPRRIPAPSAPPIQAQSAEPKPVQAKASVPSAPDLFANRRKPEVDLDFLNEEE